MTEIIQPKIDELGDQFEELQQNTVEKGKICYLMFQVLSLALYQNSLKSDQNEPKKWFKR